jgi:hypothetical protein
LSNFSIGSVVMCDLYYITRITFGKSYGNIQSQKSSSS